MSDDVERLAKYYDDLVPDDNGEFVRFKDYERLRAERDRLASQLRLATIRIEELGKESEWKAMKQLVCADYHIVPADKIDAARKRMKKLMASENTAEHFMGRGIEAALRQDFGIVECDHPVIEGESAEDRAARIAACESCHGHGWDVKDAEVEPEFQWFEPPELVKWHCPHCGGEAHGFVLLSGEGFVCGWCGKVYDPVVQRREVKP